MKKLFFTTLLLATPAFAQKQAGWPDVLYFGIIPTEGSSATLEKWTPLAKHLESKLGIKVKLDVGADYAAVILAMKAKKVDVAYFGPASYIQAAEMAGAQAFARENTVKGGASYRSILISKAGSSIKSIQDARGQDFAFVDPNSTSGYLVPMVHLAKDLGIKPDEYFKRVVFAGTHENVILNVANGKIPLGATNDLDLQRAITAGQVQEKDVQVLWTSKPIPSSPLAYRKSLPASLKKALTDAVLGFNDPESFKALGLKGYVKTSDKDYNPTRDLEAFKKSLANK